MARPLSSHQPLRYAVTASVTKRLLCADWTATRVRRPETWQRVVSQVTADGGQVNRLLLEGWQSCPREPAAARTRMSVSPWLWQ